MRHKSVLIERFRSLRMTIIPVSVVLFPLFNSVGLVSAADLLSVTGNLLRVIAIDTDTKPESINDEKDRVRKLKEPTIVVTVLDSDGKPLSGASIHASIWSDDPTKKNRDFTTDEMGRVTIELPKKIEILRLWAYHAGHVSMFANWSPRDQFPRMIPQTFTFRLNEGIVIGGTVKDENGKPIAGAKVAVMLVNPRREDGLEKHAIPNTWLAYGEDRKTTNEEGRWSLDTAPAGEEWKFRLMFEHPDFVSDDGWGVLQKQQDVQTESFRDQTATIVMHSGIRLSGQVLDSEGTAIVDAVVIRGDDPYSTEGSQETRTDKEGRYYFPPLRPGSEKVTVVATNMTPSQQSVALIEKAAIADFFLTPGKRLRIKFVDKAGIPIPGVGVGIEQWRGGKALYNHKHPNVLDTQIPVFADENGIYEWNGAPDDPVIYNIYKEGFRAVERLSLTAANDEEFEVSLDK